MNIIAKTLKEFGAKKGFFFREFKFEFKEFRFLVKYSQEQMVLHLKIIVYCRPSFLLCVLHQKKNLWFCRLNKVASLNFKNNLNVLTNDQNRATEHFLNPKNQDLIETYMAEGQGQYQELRSLLGNLPSFVDSIVFHKDRIVSHELLLDEERFGDILKKHINFMAQIAESFGSHNYIGR